MDLGTILRKATLGTTLVSLVLAPNIATAKRGDYFLLEQETALPYSIGIAAPQPLPTDGKKKGPCPPYLCPEQSNPLAQPAGAKPAYVSPEKEDSSSKKKDSSDYLFGGLALLGGTALIILGANKATVCSDDKIGMDESSCKSEIPPFGYMLMGGGAAIDILGLYYLFR